MSNLTNNTASLEALLNKANALPDKSDGIDTSDATITPDTVFLNETGYANGQKVTGTFTIEDEVSEQENLIAQIASALEGKAASGEASLNVDNSNAIGTFMMDDDGDYIYTFSYVKETTWEKFINSGLGTANDGYGFKNYNSYIDFSMGSVSCGDVSADGVNSVHPSDLIIDGHTYTVLGW